jgi:hypothetical protein
VHLASGIPCALSIGRTRNSWQNSGAWRGEIAETCPVVIPRESGGPSTPRLIGSIAAVSGILGRPIKSGDDDKSLWLFEI